MKDGGRRTAGLVERRSEDGNARPAEEIIVSIELHHPITFASRLT
jgi:hypothetical protein